MKLEINKSYSIFTTSDYISNTKVKVLGFISYERASQYSTFVENVAINEKFIDISGDTLSYLRSTIYYDCGVIEYQEGEWVLTGEHVIVWDDILDMDRTTRINEEYVYRMAITFKNLSSTDAITKEDIVKLINTVINSTYNSEKERVNITLQAVSDNAIESTESKLEKTEELLEKVNETLNTIVSLQDTAKSIVTDIKDNNLVDKVNTVDEIVDNILENTNLILQKTQ